MSHPARRGLGRGLASLIPDEAFDDPQAGAAVDLRQVPVQEIRPNPEQPRRQFDDVELQALTASIRAEGILSPLVVRRDEGRYYLIAGERRLRAAALAGLSEVPVIVREATRPARQLELALVENLLRSDLDPIEEAQGYARLVHDFDYTQAEVAERIGRDRSTVANAIRLLNLPEAVLDALRAGRIRAGHGRALLGLPDAAAQRALAERIDAEGLSVRAVERRVRAHGRRRSDAGAAARRQREAEVAGATRTLIRALGTRVAIEPRKDGGGRIVLDYGDREHLEALIERLSGS